MKLEECKICGNCFDQQSGQFTIHLKKEHNDGIERNVRIDKNRVR